MKADRIRFYKAGLKIRQLGEERKMKELREEEAKKLFYLFIQVK